jgi:hypothetical protein
MRIRIAFALFVLLGVCSVASTKHTPETKPQLVIPGGGLPTPCIPTTVCQTAK